MSNAVRQALIRVGKNGDQQVLALAGDFTLEARALLNANKVEVLQLSDFGWTDRRYKSIKAPPDRLPVY
jgi:hypothetical protein